MRHNILTLCLTIFAFGTSALSALEIEDERTFSIVNGTKNLNIISTTDLNIFAPVVVAFQRENPTTTVNYTIVSSLELYTAINNNEGNFDLAISSAMDLQTKLVNDGKAQKFSSRIVDTIPPWASWRSEIFAFTKEPAVLLYSKVAMEGLDIPQTRSELIELLRDHPDRFQGKIGTYDIRQSGLGYLYATQDSRASQTYWSLMEVLGQLGVRLFCCSSQMIDQLESGSLSIAYNVLGSYSRVEIAGGNPKIELVKLNDFSTIMLRTALIPKTSNNSEIAGRMIDFLLRLNTMPDLLELTGFSPINEIGLVGDNSTTTIRLGPSLLVYLDQKKRQRFIQAWESAVDQN